MQLHLNYQPTEDRLLLVTETGDRSSAWWLTRSLALRWVDAWVGKVAEVPLPDIPLMTGGTSSRSRPRDLSQEHALSLEFDGPATGRPTTRPDPSHIHLLQQVNIRVTPLDTRLTLKALPAHQWVMRLTRKESHACLEMLARKIRHIGWLNGHDGWPEWLGRPGEPLETA